MTCKYYFAKVRSTLMALVLFVFAGIGQVNAQSDAVPTDPAIISAGQSLFNANCKTCHKVQERLIGPALENVYDRQNIEWITNFVQNSQKVIQSGDEYAVDLFKEYNSLPMTSFDFSPEEILSILAYVKDQTDNPPVAEVPVVVVDPSGSTSGKYINIILIGLGVVLLLIVIVLAMIVSVMKKTAAQKKGLSSEDQELAEMGSGFGGLIQNKAFIGVVAFVVTAVLLKVGIDGLFSIGVQQGYSPDQPIAYSHKLHAGDLQIDCNYCHTGVTKSKNANIPSANICMNCHNSITTGTNTGETEIAKIYEAIETNTPIEWVRVHNLPDFAYFNHSQHVNVGGVDCISCHGDIASMEVVKQENNLTMGWCISCHRTTEIDTRGNGYYDKLVELHEMNQGKDPFTVESNGGLDCAKCHY